MDDKGRDVSSVIRGRLYQLKEIIGLGEELDSYDRMKSELAALENEGYKASPDEGLPS
jgi:plasmid replication initiation protein